MSEKRYNNGTEIGCFTPQKGETITSPYTPDSDTIMMFTSDVDITLDGVTGSFGAGDVICLAKNVTYTLSNDVDVLVM